MFLVVLLGILHWQSSRKIPCECGRLEGEVAGREASQSGRGGINWS